MTRAYPGGGMVAVKETWIYVGALVERKRGSGPSWIAQKRCSSRRQPEAA